MAEIELNRRIQDFLKSALARVDSKDYDEALKVLKSAEELDKENPVILYNTGVCYTGLRNYREAVLYFQKILSMPQAFVDIVSVRKLLSYCLIMMEDFDEALVYLDQSLSISRLDTSAMNMKGYCYEKQKEFDKAISVYREIIEIDGENSNASNSLAYIMALNNKDLNRALRYAKKALEVKPDNPAYLDTLGMIYMKKNQPDMAKKFLKKALSIMPESEEIKKHVNQLLKIEQ